MSWLDSLDAWKTRVPEEEDVAGEPCPVCGDATLGGTGPCSDECAREMGIADTQPPERLVASEVSEEIADELRGERFDEIARRGW